MIGEILNLIHSVTNGWRTHPATHDERGCSIDPKIAIIESIPYPRSKTNLRVTQVNEEGVWQVTDKKNATIALVVKEPETGDLIAFGDTTENIPSLILKVKAIINGLNS